LQSYDLTYDRHLARQALSRTNVTNTNIAPNAHNITVPIVSHLQISHDGAWLATVDEWLPPKRDLEFLGLHGADLEDEQRRRREVFLKFWQWNESDGIWALVSRIDAPHTMAGEQYGSGRVLALVADPSSLTFSTLGEDNVVRIWTRKVRKRDGVVVRGNDGKPLYSWHSRLQVSLGTAEFEDEERRIPAHGCLAFSKDGSVLAAAMSGTVGGFIHVINPFAGTIRASYRTLCRGDLIGLAIIHKYLIILSDNLLVFDLVFEETSYGITLDDRIKSQLSLEQKAEMIHLAVNNTGRTFAVAFPCIDHRDGVDSDWAGLISKAYSELVVFDPDDPTPLHTATLPSLTTALVPLTSSAGFLVLDAAAEIRTVSPKATQTVVPGVRSLVEYKLDLRSLEDPESNSMEITGDVDEEHEPESDVEDEIAEAAEETPLDFDDDGPRNFTLHQLAEALNPTGDPSSHFNPSESVTAKFYRVADLICVKPRSKKGT
jgi:NET1-associated nuclear protein 1 (U3 small nucleolar RNA-associated protein 17)